MRLLGSDLAGSGGFKQQQANLPGIVKDEVWSGCQQDAAGLLADWRSLALDMWQGLNRHTRQAIASALSLYCVI